SRNRRWGCRLREQTLQRHHPARSRAVGAQDRGSLNLPVRAVLGGVQQMTSASWFAADVQLGPTAQMLADLSDDAARGAPWSETGVLISPHPSCWPKAQS